MPAVVLFYGHLGEIAGISKAKDMARTRMWIHDMAWMDSF